MILLDRQLRLVHVQPRAPVRRAGRGGARAAERRDHGRRGGGAAARAARHLARARAGRRAPGRRSRSCAGWRRGRADARRVPRPPGDRGGVRRRDRLRARSCCTASRRASRTTGAGCSAGCRSASRPGATTRWPRRACPDCLEVSATCDEGEVMAVRHRELPIDGVQFHPESVLTPVGPDAGAQLPGGVVIQAALADLLEGRDLGARAGARGDDRRSWTARRRRRRSAATSCALRMKGETADEIAGSAEAMRAHVVAVRPQRDDLVDTAGTGGDGANTFNISTAAALVAAAAGAGVAKHGNRAASSATGAADVLEALGFRLELPPERIERSIDELGFGFLFAQAHHPAMRHAGPVRRELAARTIFNVLGPLTNPAGARAQVLGVYSPELVRTIAEALVQLDARRAYVVHGAGGIDELSPAGPNLVCEVRRRARCASTSSIRWSSGIPRCDPAELRGGDPATNAAALRACSAARRAGTARRCPQRGGRDRGRRAMRPTCARGSGSRARRSTPARRRRGSTSSSRSRRKAHRREPRSTHFRHSSGSGARVAPPGGATWTWPGGHGPRTGLCGGTARSAHLGRRAGSVPPGGRRWDMAGRDVADGTVPRRARRARAGGDRRVQAPLAVGRRHPARGRPRARSRPPTRPPARPRSPCSSTSASPARSTTSAPRAPRPTRRCSPRASSRPEEQLRELREAGADAALLLLRDLDDEQTARAHAPTPAELGLDTLVEAHDAGGAAPRRGARRARDRRQRARPLDLHDRPPHPAPARGAARRATA